MGFNHSVPCEHASAASGHCFAGPGSLQALFAQNPADASGGGRVLGTLFQASMPQLQAHAACLLGRPFWCAQERRGHPAMGYPACGMLAAGQRRVQPHPAPTMGRSPPPSPRADLTNFVEFPAEARTLGQLTTHSLPDEPGQLQFAWLSEAGVFHGRIDVTRSTVPPSALEYLPHRGLLPFPQSLSSSSGGALQAPSMLLAVVSNPAKSRQGCSPKRFEGTRTSQKARDCCVGSMLLDLSGPSRAAGVRAGLPGKQHVGAVTGWSCSDTPSCSHL